MTDLNNLTDKELSVRLRDVFQAEICRECRLNPDTCGHLPGCGKISITPANAYKYRDRAVERHGNKAWQEALGAVHASLYFPRGKQVDVQFYDYIEWLEIKIQPRDLLIAAAKLERKDK